MRRVILEIRFGPRACQKAVVEPGQKIRVGRSERADLSVPNDERMSLQHLALSWDGAICRFEDLGSHAGTSLNGEPRAGGEIANGGWIQAGSTVLSVYFEAATPPRGKPREPTSQQRVALAALRDEGEGLFAVLDASRDKRLLELLHESVEPYRSLYDGVQGDALAEVAPYLVRFAAGSGLLDRLVNEGWGKRWGVFLKHRRPFDEVRRHLRRFLMVEDEETGERMYFRFYDPATLRSFLPTCSRRQEAQLFGEVDRFLMEDEEGRVVRFFPGEAR
ncbi:DUF4123 domain-containing protein [Sorangium sp. So ce1128]